MPVVTGETLRARLEREHQLPIADAVRIAREVASALDYAHRQGVVHRDIKPENILLHDGSALVADFGIALAVQTAGGQRMTQTGLSLGTPSYMSPEQAMGEKTIDARSDVYALGAVSYEMLTGDAPFTGSTVQAIVAKVLNSDPDRPSLMRKTIPPAVEGAVMTALAKLPADRFSSTAEFAAALDGRGAPSPAERHASVSAGDGRWRLVAIAASALAIVSTGAALWSVLGTPGTDTERVTFAFRPPQVNGVRPQVAISPDGRKIVQVSEDSAAVAHLYIRDLGATTLAKVPGTDGASDPEFSPDGASLVLVNDGKLRRMPVVGGPSTVLADSVTAGVYWSDDGFVLYTKSSQGLWRVPAEGGTPQQLTSLDSSRKEFNHWYPQALPGGKAAIFNSFSTPFAKSRIEAVEYKTGKRTVLIDGAIFGRYVPTGHLLFARDAALFAVPFDASKLRVLGPPVPVLEDLAWSPTNGLGGYAVSSNGTLVYIKGSEWSVGRRVVWADRTGKEQPLLPEPGQWAEPRLSPDGRWLALTRLDPDWQIVLFDLTRRVFSQLTRSAGVSFNPIWMPDSRSVIHSVETPVYDLVRAPVDGSPPARVKETPFDKMANAASPDGKSVVYHETRDRDRLMIAPVADGEAVLVEDRPTSQRNGAFSPDGRWLAYVELGADQRPQVFVRAIGANGGRRQVSASGGDQPRWTRGGREIVYRNGEAMYSAAFTPATGEVGTPAFLFRRSDAGRLGGNRTLGYDVTPDGSRFVLIVPVERPEAQPMIVVLHWLNELKVKVKP
jgi:serine/threonine-protein kinase